jgi:hypothetical protein
MTEKKAMDELRVDIDRYEMMRIIRPEMRYYTHARC